MHSWSRILVGMMRMFGASAVAVFVATVLSGCAILGGGGHGGDDGPSFGLGGEAEAGIGDGGTNTVQQISPESDFEVQKISFSPSGEPILRPGYIISVTVMVGEKTETQAEVQISASCDVTLPLVGSIDCTGLTLNGLRSKLASGYGEYFHDPEVRANFVVKGPATSPWGRVFVGGRVRKEGWVVIPATRSLTVSEAIAHAGGFGTYARRDNIRVTRVDERGKKKRFRVNLEEIARKGKVENDMLLKHGDVVWVRETSI
ncbi:MAG: polysaccharide biosynthesis/export family protein [Kiritimatiellae bacterium]|nr:polysaccharide biosynthesis/export family protein [Kiritimatiellia bacterium]